MVYNQTTSKLTFEPFIWPLDELELSRTGMAAGATQHDVACQIELSTAEPLVLLPPKNPTRMPTPKEPVASVDAPVGPRVKVFWQGVKGQPELDKWYEGIVVSITALANGQLRHVIKYDGWGRARARPRQRRKAVDAAERERVPFAGPRERQR